MSKVQQIVCDAPKCSQIRGSVNGWFVVRGYTDLEFEVTPMHGAEEEDGDRHICSSPCLHALLEAWIESNQAKPIPDPEPAYEVGSLS